MNKNIFSRTKQSIMNADVVRQRIAANGRLFDVNGRSSMGSLPRGELVVKELPVENPGSETTNDFSIGSEELQRNRIKLDELPPDARRREEFMRMEGMSRPGTSFRHPDELANPDRALARMRQTKKNLAMNSEQVLAELPAPRDFLNQGVSNPVKPIQK